MSFINSSLSYSRISKFEQCPLSFKFAYVDKLPSGFSMPAEFGRVVHTVLEDLVKEHVKAEVAGPLCEARALELLKHAWTEAGLVGVAEYAEARDIVRTFVRDEGDIDPVDVLGLEQPFEIQVGRFKLIGYIDRVDRIEDEGVLIRDYKTFRILPERHEVDANLQLSLYNVAARALYPWAKHIQLELHALRHGVRLRTQRTTEQLESALDYAESLGQQSETVDVYRPKLNANCVYCDHRANCPSYANALAGQRDVICEDLTDLELVAKEREEAAVLAKIMYSRREQLDDVLKAHIEAHGELVLSGMKYKVFNMTRRDFPVGRTLKVLSDASGKSESELLEKLGSLENKGVDALVKSLGSKLGKSKASLLKLEVDALAEKTLSSRLWVTRAA